MPYLNGERSGVALSTVLVVLLVIIILVVALATSFGRTHTVRWAQTGYGSLDGALPRCAWPSDQAHIHGGRVTIRDANGRRCADIVARHVLARDVKESGTGGGVTKACSGAPDTWTYRGTGEYVCRKRKDCREGLEMGNVVWDERSN